MGIKGDKKSQQSVKPKQKMALAKDKKQLSIAFVVIGLFVANTIYTIIKVMMDQGIISSPAPAASVAQTAMGPEMPGAASTATAAVQTAMSTAQSVQTAAMDSASHVVSHAAPVAAASGGGNALPFVLVGLLILVALVGGFFLFKKSRGSSSASDSPSETSDNGKITLAKDKKQLIIAGVVIVLFLLNTVFITIKIMMDQGIISSPVPAGSKTVTVAPEGMPNGVNTAQTAANPQPSPVQGQPNPTNAMMQPGPAVQGQQPSGPPIALIAGIIILAIVGGVGFVVFKKFSSGGVNLSGQKPKFELAKDPKQLALAIVVIGFFIVKTSYDVINYFVVQVREDAQIKQAAMNMARNQQQNLQSLGQYGPSPVGIQSPQDSSSIQNDANDIYSQTVNMNNGGSSSKVSNQQEDGVEIMARGASSQRMGKMVMIQVDESGRSNPFLPAAENFVPSAAPKFSLLPPPEDISAGSDAESVMGTTISGIMYDKYSPSAIINISGTDYLVKRGDVVNRYKVLSIGKDQVVVQLGNNVYKAGVGQILSQGQVNLNVVSNLDKKFGGNSVSINVKKKKY